MTQATSSPGFQETIDMVESLPPDDQLLLIELIRQRLIHHRRVGLAADVRKARRAYQRGQVRRGTVGELMEDLAE